LKRHNICPALPIEERIMEKESALLLRPNAKQQPSQYRPGKKLPRAVFLSEKIHFLLTVVNHVNTVVDYYKISFPL